LFERTTVIGIALVKLHDFLGSFLTAAAEDIIRRKRNIKDVRNDVIVTHGGKLVKKLQPGGTACMVD